MSKYLFLVADIHSAKGICTRAVMEELVDRGHQVICLTNMNLIITEGQILNGVSYKLVRPRLSSLLAEQERRLSNKFLKKLCKTISFLANKTKLVLTVFSWPLVSPIYSWRYYKKALKICKNFMIDHIVPVYTQIDSIIAAYLVKKKFLQIKYSPYMLDALSAGYGPKMFSRAWLERRGESWERLLFSNADQVLFMRSSEQHYNKNEEYKGLYTFVDLPLVKLNDTNERFEMFDQKYISIVYTGSIPQHIRNPKYIVELLLSLNMENLRLYFIGVGDNRYLSSKIRESDSIVIIPYLPHEECMKAINSADFLLNLGNSQPYMMPSKLFEYFSTGKPIISTYSNESDNTLDYITRYPHSLMIKEHDELMADDADRLIKFLMNERGKVIGFKKVKEMFIENTPEYTADVIESITYCTILKEGLSCENIRSI